MCKAFLWVILDGLKIRFGGTIVLLQTNALSVCSSKKFHVFNIDLTFTSAQIINRLLLQDKYRIFLHIIGHQQMELVQTLRTYSNSIPQISDKEIPLKFWLGGAFKTANRCLSLKD